MPWFNFTWSWDKDRDKGFLDMGRDWKVDIRRTENDSRDIPFPFEVLEYLKVDTNGLCLVFDDGIFVG